MVKLKSIGATHRWWGNRPFGAILFLHKNFHWNWQNVRRNVLSILVLFLYLIVPDPLRFLLALCEICDLIVCFLYIRILIYSNFAVFLFSNFAVFASVFVYSNFAVFAFKLYYFMYSKFGCASNFFPNRDHFACCNKRVYFLSVSSTDHSRTLAADLYAFWICSHRQRALSSLTALTGSCYSVNQSMCVCVFNLKFSASHCPWPFPSLTIQRVPRCVLNR